MTVTVTRKTWYRTCYTAFVVAVVAEHIYPPVIGHRQALAI